MRKSNEQWMLLSIILFGVVILTACVIGGTATEVKPAVSETASIIVDDSGAFSTSEPETSTATQSPVGNDGGLWSLLRTSDGLWRMHLDGTELSPLPEKPSLDPDPRFFEQALSPNGRYLAFLSAPDSSRRYDQPILTILSLPSGEVQQTVLLTTPDTNPDPDAMPGDPVFEAVRAIIEVDSYAWSPDGSGLAFMGVLDGPSSDLYLVTLESGEITRLTDGPTQGIRPVWSPDGRFIVHVAVSGLGTGAGYSVKGVWAAAADGSVVTLLYEPNSGDEIVDGWLDNNRFVVHSWRASCGEENLRVVDVATGEQQVLWKGAFRQVAVDPNSSTVVVGVDEGATSCNDEQGTGIFIIPEGGSSLRVLEDEIVQMEWSSEANLFFALTGFGVVAVSPSGDLIDLDVPFEPNIRDYIPAVEPSTRKLAWASGEGVWISELTSGLDNPPRQIMSGAASFARWGIDADMLFFSVEGNLYQAHSPQWEPILISESLKAFDFALIGQVDE